MFSEYANTLSRVYRALRGCLSSRYSGAIRLIFGRHTGAIAANTCRIVYENRPLDRRGIVDTSAARNAIFQRIRQAQGRPEQVADAARR